MCIRDSLCIKVNFASGGEDLLILKKSSQYIYEGYMAGDTDVVVTMIESLKEKERLVGIYILRCFTVRN